MSYVIRNRGGAIFTVPQKLYTLEQLKSKAKDDGWTVLKPYSIEDMSNDLRSRQKEVFECSECGAEFASEKGLNIHKALVHK